jgi:hypothetical protein
VEDVVVLVVTVEDVVVLVVVVVVEVRVTEFRLFLAKKGWDAGPPFRLFLVIFTNGMKSITHRSQRWSLSPAAG